MTIPLEEGFTVVTGPNGSGKSNILDGVLFCLGLATSRGMRADRLPDLVNSGMLKAGKAAETTVSVRFDLSDWTPDAAEEGLEAPAEGPWIQPGQTEWTVTRKLRVMPGDRIECVYLDVQNTFPGHEKERKGMVLGNVPTDGIVRIIGTQLRQPQIGRASCRERV